MHTLLAVDGSPESDEAVKALAHFAPADHLVVFHALDVPHPAYPMMMPDVAQTLYHESEQGIREDAERLLKHVSSILPEDTGPVTTRLQIGSPAEKILTVAEKEDIGLIVMGARGLGKVEEVLLGSVTHRVVSYATCPILVVNTAMPRLRSLLLAVEGPEDADAAIRFLATKPFRHPVQITVLTALPPSHSPRPDGSESDALREKALRSAWCFVWDVAGKVSGLRYQAEGLVGMGNPGPTILKQAATLKPDLIMLGSHGKRGITRFLLGSVSHAVLHSSPCPVLIVC